MKNLKVKNRNYTPGSMSFMSGFLGPRGDVGFFMIVDWEKAKKIINQLLITSDKKIENVELGLDGDWDYNSMTVWESDVFFKYDCYNESQWAEPILLVNYSDGSNETYSCWFRKIEVEGISVDEPKLLN